MQKKIHHISKVKVMAFLVIIILSGSCANHESMKIYVSVSGDDKNYGSEKKPLATIDAALEKVRELKRREPVMVPIEIILGGGDYFIRKPIVLGPEDSGSEGAPLIFRAKSGEKPIIYGGKKIEGFEAVSPDLWRVEIPEVTELGWYFEQLYVNGKRAVRAKSPNEGLFPMGKVTESGFYSRGEGRGLTSAMQKIKISSEGTKELNSFTWNDYQDAVITIYHKWCNTRKRIDWFIPDSSMLSITGRGKTRMMSKINMYSLENYKAALDSAGEWYLERSGDLYYIQRDGEQLSDLQVFAPIADQFFILKGEPGKGEKIKNIRFDGISLQVSGYRMPFYGDEPAQAASPVEAVVMADYAENIEWINGEIAHTGGNAIWFRNGCSDCLVQHNYFHDLGAGGVKIGNSTLPEKPVDLTRNIVVDNNIIRSGGFVFPSAVGVTIFHASDCQITHNEIADFRYSGISVGWKWGYSYSPSKRNKIEFNHIHHLGWGELSDMGGVYTLGESEGTTVSNNVIHHVHSFNYGGWGLYTDQASSGIILENNLVYNCKSGNFHQHWGKGNIIKNNIFANGLKAQLQATHPESHVGFTFTNNIVWFTKGDLLFHRWDKVNLQSDSNCYWNPYQQDFLFMGLSFEEWKKQSGRDQHSIIADPGLEDPHGFDFTIMDDSVISQIGFKKFDYSRAGVYGSDEWKSLAEIDPEIAQRFDRAVLRNEKIDP